MHKERKDKHFIHKPVYPGGRDALKAFIRDNLRYPKQAVEQKIEGTVSLKYTIDHTGKVIEARVVSGLGHGCDEEAIRLAKLLKFEVPKAPRKRKILFHKDLHVHFKLPRRKAPQTGTRIHYTTTTTPKTTEGEKQKSGGYQYTVTIRKKS
ncbi:MAG: energy transducer TonB [Saprospiraceae bacterium]|nr:energy transducer TonB [Saprospiraceae bacterium]